MGGVLGEDGNIYGVPCNAERVLRINPKTQEVDMTHLFYTSSTWPDEGVLWTLNSELWHAA